MGTRGHRRVVIWTAFALGFVVLFFSFLRLLGKTVPYTSKKFTPSSSVSVTVTVVNRAPVPDEFSLFQNYPNPFNVETVIEYNLAEDCHVELAIYNVLGQKIKTLVSQHQEAGHNTVRWNGRDDHGNEVASGVYFCQIQAGGYVNVKKMMSVK